MLKFFAGMRSALLLIVAAVFAWQGMAQGEADPVPRTSQKFTSAPADRDPFLTRGEFATTAPPRRPQRQPNCAC